MKNLLLVILSFVFYSASAQMSFNTGSSQLDADLNTINARASVNFARFRANMNLSYNVTEKKVDFMKATLGMEPGEIYLALEISKIARVQLDDVLSIYKTNKAKGWGYIAKQAGIKPGSAEFHELKNGAHSRKGRGPGKKGSQGKGNQKNKKAGI